MRLFSRKQLIKEAERFRKRQMKSRHLFGSSSKLRKEVFINTELGKVRTLWYGFESPEILPVYFSLHGGGFISGFAEMDESINIEINKQVGCKAISIEYVKAPEFPYPVAINQVYSVIKYIFENAKKYAINGKKMAIVGHSSGGNLSAAVCMKANKKKDFRLMCQALDCPVLDIATGGFDKPQPKGCIPPDLAAIFDACYIDPAKAKDPYVSPVYAKEEDIKGLPPALFILAVGDSLYDEGLKYCEMLKRAGVLTECYEYLDSAHAFMYKPSAESSDAIEKISAFLIRYFK
jgi:acetyl esterase